MSRPRSRRPAVGRGARRLHHPWPGLQAIVRSVCIRNPLTFDVEGRPHRLGPSAPAGDGTDPVGRIRVALADAVYQRFHCRLPPSLVETGELPDGSAAFVAALSAANRGTSTWDPGWTVMGTEPDGTLIVAKDGIRFWTDPFRVRHPYGLPEPGGDVRVLVANERRHLLPGFYLALGDADEPSVGGQPQPIVRVYWNLGSAAAGVAFVEILTRALNRAGFPFRLKVPSDPLLYARADGGVLYLPRQAFRRAVPIVRGAHRTLRPSLRSLVPLLARQLAPGLSLAEDPGTEESFGQHRSRLVAEGLWAAFAAGHSRQAGRLEEVAATFARAGLDPARPYLSAGSDDADLLG